jgi:hypothetical protein
MNHKSLEETVLCGRELHVLLSKAHGPFVEVDRKLTQYEDWLAFDCADSALGCSNTRQELACSKRLGEVIIGTRVQRGDFGGLLSLYR